MNRSALLLVVAFIVLGCGKKRDDDYSGEPSGGGGSTTPSRKQSPPDPDPKKPGPIRNPRDAKSDDGQVVAAVGFREWSEAGDLRVKVSGAKIGKPKIEDDDSDGDFLMLDLTIQNRSKVKKLEYSRPSPLDFDGSAKLIDEHGNDYRLHPFESLEKVNGRKGYATVYPDAPPIEDVLCFQVPVSAASELRFTLKPSWAGGSSFVFRIPSSAWKK